MSPDARFPDDLSPGMRPLFGDVGKDLVSLTRRILSATSVALGLGRDFLPDLHSKLLVDGNRSDMRSLYYPPINGISNFA